jgi:hypothetical protein
MLNGLLDNTKCTVIGPMQYSPLEGKGDRDYITQILKEKLNITVFNHYNNPFLNTEHEDIESINNINDLIKNGKFEEVEKYKYIRLNDLSLIDRSDFIIFLYNKNIPMCGAFEEFFIANKLKKPIFVVCKDGKTNASAWLFWTITHKYMYNSFDECLETLIKINNYELKIDSDRWKLLRHEYR